MICHTLTQKHSSIGVSPLPTFISMHVCLKISYNMECAVNFKGALNLGFWGKNQLGFALNGCF